MKFIWLLCLLVATSSYAFPVMYVDGNDQAWVMEAGLRDGEGTLCIRYFHFPGRRCVYFPGYENQPATRWCNKKIRKNCVLHPLPNEYPNSAIGI